MQRNLTACALYHYLIQVCVTSSQLQSRFCKPLNITITHNTLPQAVLELIDKSRHHGRLEHLLEHIIKSDEGSKEMVHLETVLLIENNTVAVSITGDLQKLFNKIRGSTWDITKNAIFLNELYSKSNNLIDLAEFEARLQECNTYIVVIGEVSAFDVNDTRSQHGTNIDIEFQFMYLSDIPTFMLLPKKKVLSMKQNSMLDRIISLHEKKWPSSNLLCYEDELDIITRFQHLVYNQQHPSSNLIREMRLRSVQQAILRYRSQVFISYSHSPQDKKYLKRLKVHLKSLERQGIEYWDDTRIKPGSNWREEIADALNKAKVAVLLISADFLASDFISESELPQLLAAAEQDGAVILPVIISTCRFKNSLLSQFQSVNPPEKPLDKQTVANRNVWLNKVCEAIEEALKSS